MPRNWKKIADALKSVPYFRVCIVYFILVPALSEVCCQVLAWKYPAYDALIWEPDRSIGWKLAPNNSWIWAGNSWFAQEFSVHGKSNSLGFRDLERKVEKGDTTRRVAMLGDSLIEALQVPLESVSSQILEKRLNSDQLNRSHTLKWEVLNFGISNFSVGQFFLTWRAYAKQFKPNVVTVMVARFHFDRTVSDEVESVQGTYNQRLSIRPTFQLSNNVLVERPASEFELFREVQQRKIKEGYSGNRSRRRVSFVLGLLAQQFFPKTAAPGILQSADQSVAFESEEGNSSRINFHILKELNKEVSESGGKLVVLDISEVFSDPAEFTEILKDFSNSEKITYLSISKDLFAANSSRGPVRWGVDGHLNELGNEIVAESIFKVIRDYP